MRKHIVYLLILLAVPIMVYADSAIIGGVVGGGGSTADTLIEKDTTTTPDTIKPKTDGEGYQVVSPDGTKSAKLYINNADEVQLDGFAGEFSVAGANLCADDIPGVLFYVYNCSVATPSTQYAFLQTPAGVTVFNSTANFEFRRTNTTIWLFDSTSHLRPAANNAYDIGSSSFKARNVYVGTSINNSGLTVNPPQSVTCSDTGDANPGTLAITPTGSYIEITNSDADGCNVTIADSGTVGAKIDIVVVSNAGGAVDFADIDGQQEVAQGGTLTRGVNDSAIFRRGNDGGDGTWRLIGEQNN